MPKFNAISVAGAHFRDAGANAAQEMAFTLMDGVTYCDEVVSRGRMTIDEFAPQVSFFFYTHGDFFEEIAKYRAGRRRWARIVKERYGAKDEKSCMFRVGCVAGGASLYAPQAHNNIVRVAYEALASVLGGVQSMFTAAWDEPFALPTEESTTLALRTQQMLAYETGVRKVADPLGGSYYVEALTDAMEAKVIEIMEDLERQGGMVEAVEKGYLHALIADEAFRIAAEARQRRASGRRGQHVRDRRARARGRGLRARREGPSSAAGAPGGGEAQPVVRRRDVDAWRARSRGRQGRRQPDAAAGRRREGVLHGGRDGRGAEEPVGRVLAAGGVLVPARVLVAKPGLDGHDRGAKLVARVLRDAGFEVVYLGIRQRPVEIAAIAVQEDVDVVGLSILSGAHVALTRKTHDAMVEAGGDDIPLVVGGTIPQSDVPKLKDAGAVEVYPTGTPIEQIVASMTELTVAADGARR